MMTSSKLEQTLVPVTQFNKGQTTKIFARLNTNPYLVVLKNNKPTAFILSPSEFDRLSEIEENYYLLQEAVARLSKNEKTYTQDEVMQELGLTQKDIDEAGDVEIE